MKLKSLVLAFACTFSTGALAADDFNADLADIAENTISTWVAAPVVLDALRVQNTRTAELSEEQILSMDATWRDQTVSGGALVDGLLSNPLSQHLKALKMEGQGRYSEIFISDARGLNVGQSDLTSDYWQGDEDKWQVPHATSDVHIGEVEFDESTQSYQSQVSVPIIEGDAFLGVITVGINLEQLAAN